MNRLTRIALASGATLAAVSAPASASPPERYDIVNIEVIEDYCDVPGRPDLTIRREQYITGMFAGRSLGPDGLAYFSDQLRFTTVRTNVENGKSLTSEGINNFRDQRVIDNGDGTLTITSSLIGSDRSYDGSGTIVDRLALRYEFEALVDHAGTPTDPSDDVFLGGTLTKLVGQGDDGAFCLLAHDVLE